jgi:4-amino-4-deoxy-L-arabinose transferase-like glycosyltransferase
MFGLAHASIEFLLAGGIVFIGLMALIIRLVLGQIGHVTASVIVWIFVYSIHGGKANVGIMTATFAALLFDLFGFAIIKGVIWLKGCLSSQ